MEYQILHAIQELHANWLNPIMIFVSAVGNNGYFWIGVAIILLFPKKTRRCAFTMAGAMALSFILGNLIIKNVVARPRPFVNDTTVTLLIKQPGEYSFPSGHTLNGFTAATVIFWHFKKWGIGAYLFAALIAFSRMYLFVHFPTDILGGIALGCLDAILCCLVAKKIAEIVKRRMEQRVGEEPVKAESEMQTTGSKEN